MDLVEISAATSSEDTCMKQTSLSLILLMKPCDKDTMCSSKMSHCGAAPRLHRTQHGLIVSAYLYVIDTKDVFY